MGIWIHDDYNRKQNNCKDQKYFCKHAGVQQYASGRYKVNAKIVQLAKQAAANARMIVQKFSSYTETEKLIGYKEIICYLTSYNDEAVEWEEYGDPWQLIYVFDGDDSTNVVCEVIP
mgnify:CR=1 FL=1